MNNNEDSNPREISFSVDAGLIDRLGRELVGKAETAVSELVKNSYDSDAREVVVNFINSYEEGGTLEISDDGSGMSFDQLQKGFMTISSTDKIHNPTSERYHRSKAGRKGIGRFATQRLGEKLIILTQTLSSEKALRLTIDWEKYTRDQDISKIFNTVEEVEKIRPEGTTLTIKNLRESWSEVSIKRIYRYVSDLFQPDYLSNKVGLQNIANQNDETFNVSFNITLGGQKIEVASPKKMLFDKSLAIIEGYVDSIGDGFAGVISDRLGLEDYAVPIDNSKSEKKFLHLRNIHFKAYYFIYNRVDYYTNITKLELNSIQKIAHESGGIRLYRNGFRVLPYGEPKDDWLGLDIRYSGSSGLTNIPFSNNNLFGFVEILDQEGFSFQETASREGLIENTAFNELVKFLDKAFEFARLRISEKITIVRRNNTTTPSSLGSANSNAPQTIEEQFEKLNEELEVSPSNDSVRETIKIIQEKYYQVIEEVSMLRILASLGLTIGEFTHEIIQFTPSINGFISKLYEANRDPLTIPILDSLKSAFANFTSYSSFFNATVSENTSREVKPILITDIVNEFSKNIKDDLDRQNTQLEIDSFGYDLYTLPMHISEWSSILYNLYTNSKKAIKREACPGKIKILTGHEEKNIYLEFHDNGDGIPEENRNRVFNAFFTTSSPAGFDSPLDEKLTGTGLGLKIVKDIIETYNGTVKIIRPDRGFTTCFRIEVPQADEKQLSEYGI